MASNPSLRWVALLLCMVPVTGFAFILWGASFFQRVHAMDTTEHGFWLGGAMEAGLVLVHRATGWVDDRYGLSKPRLPGSFAGYGCTVTFPFSLRFALSVPTYY